MIASAQKKNIIFHEKLFQVISKNLSILFGTVIVVQGSLITPLVFIYFVKPSLHMNGKQDYRK